MVHQRMVGLAGVAVGHVVATEAAATVTDGAAATDDAGLVAVLAFRDVVAVDVAADRGAGDHASDGRGTAAVTVTHLVAYRATDQRAEQRAVGGAVAAIEATILVTVVAAFVGIAALVPAFLAQVTGVAP